MTTEVKKFGTKELDVFHQHALALHHYKLDLSLIHTINFLDIIPNNPKKVKTYSKEYIIAILYKYGISDYFWESKLLFIGETTTDPIEPIFMKENGHFYSYKNDEYYPNYQIEVSTVLNVPVYKFVKEYNNPKVPTLVDDLKDVQKENDKLTPVDVIPFTGIYDNEKEMIYLFDRMRISSSQKEQIMINFLDYNVLYELNKDRTVVVETGKSLFRSHQQLGFRDYKQIQNACYTWNKKEFNDEAFKYVLLAGFTAEYNGVRRPVYLKSNGWFSDGYNDYSPTYESFIITKETLQKCGMLESTIKTKDDVQTLDHSYLIGKKAYIFEWGMGTMSSVVYNQWFRNQLMNIYLFQPAMNVLFASISLIAAMAIGGIAAIPISLLAIIGSKSGFLVAKTTAFNIVGGNVIKKNSSIRKNKKYLSSKRTIRKLPDNIYLLNQMYKHSLKSMPFKYYRNHTKGKY